MYLSLFYNQLFVYQQSIRTIMHNIDTSLKTNSIVVSCTHTGTYALTLRGRVVASDEMKSVVVSVDAVSRTRTECLI
jgi:hypothetical protein